MLGLVAEKVQEVLTRIKVTRSKASGSKTLKDVEFTVSYYDTTNALLNR